MIQEFLLFHLMSKDLVTLNCLDVALMLTYTKLDFASGCISLLTSPSHALHTTL